MLHCRVTNPPSALPDSIMDIQNTAKDTYLKNVVLMGQQIWAEVKGLMRQINPDYWLQLRSVLQNILSCCWKKINYGIVYGF